MKSFSKYLAEQDEFGSKYAGRKGIGLSVPIGGEIMKPGAPTGLLGMLRRGQNVSDFNKAPTSTRPTKFIQPRPGETISQAQQRKARNTGLASAATAATAGAGALETERSIAGKESAVQQRMKQLYPDLPSGRKEAYQALRQAGVPPASTLTTSEFLSGVAGTGARAGAQIGSVLAGGGPGAIGAMPQTLAVKQPATDAAKRFFDERGILRPFAGTRPNEGERGIEAAGKELEYATSVDQAIRDIMQPRYDASKGIDTKAEPTKYDPQETLDALFDDDDF